MITVVMLNWARPNNTLENLHRYASYGLVKQIFCFNNGHPLPQLSHLPAKCVLLEASRNLGVYARLAAASLAETEAIFHTDDDLFVPEPTIEALYAHWLNAKLTCHGLFGRIVHPIYQGGDVFGRVEVVLTRAMICGRRVNNVALSATDLFDDLAPEPRGNGEDIILSFAAMSLSRDQNQAYRLPAKDYPANDGLQIHRRWPNHFKHRQRVVLRCRKIFFGSD